MRNRGAMLAAIDFELSRTPAEDRESCYKSWGQDDQVRRCVMMLIIFDDDVMMMTLLIKIFR